MNAKKTTKSLMILLATTAFLNIAGYDARAASVSIAWDPPIPSEGITGYNIHFGSASRNYSASVDVGNATEGIVPDLDPDMTYYFAITAYNSAGNESEYSAELVWDNTAPTITGPSPLTLTADQSDQAPVPDLTDQVEISDNFSAAANIVVSQTPTAGTMVVPGTTVVTLTATDEAGNSSDCTVAITVNPVNRAPLVNAGQDRTITLPTASLTIDATVTDDSLPVGSDVSLQWSLVSGPASVVFAEQGIVDATVTFSQQGTYLLQLTAADGELTSSDTVTVTVRPIPVPMPPIGLRVL